MDEYNASPLPLAKACDLIKSIEFDVPTSVSQLYWEMNKPASIDVIPLGSYTSGKTTKFLFLQLADTLLPRDFAYDETRADTNLTQAKYTPDTPDTPSIPKFFYELGHLFLSSAATIDNVSTEITEFIAIVTPDRKVFALWNPNADDPEGIKPTVAEKGSFQTRPTTGVLAGFTASCTAFPLADNIDNLCNPNQSAKVLAISPTTMITLPPKATIQFGGVDSEGWVALEKAFPMFDSTKKFTPSASR